MNDRQNETKHAAQINSAEKEQPNTTGRLALERAGRKEDEMAKPGHRRPHTVAGTRVAWLGDPKMYAQIQAGWVGL